MTNFFYVLNFYLKVAKRRILNIIKLSVNNIIGIKIIKGSDYGKLLFLLKGISFNFITTFKNVMYEIVMLLD